MQSLPIIWWCICISRRYKKRKLLLSALWNNNKIVQFNNNERWMRKGSFRKKECRLDAYRSISFFFLSFVNDYHRSHWETSTIRSGSFPFPSGRTDDRGRGSDKCCEWLTYLLVVFLQLLPSFNLTPSYIKLTHIYFSF